MRKYVVAACLLIAVFLMGANSYAATMWVAGYVRDAQTQQPIVGAKLVWNMSYLEKITVYTNIDGAYWFPYHHWCDNKPVTVSGDGYFTSYRRVGEYSCCSCYPECPPAYGWIGCRSSYIVNFNLIAQPMASGMSTTLRPEVMAGNGQLLIPLVGMYFATFCNRNACDYDCLYQWAVDVANGPEYMFGKPTRPDIELPPCPDVPNFADFVNNTLDALWEYWYGDNFPDDTPEALPEE